MTPDRAAIPRPPAAVLFDLDGTLVDSVPDLALAIDVAMRAVGLPPRGEAKVRTWVGLGAATLVRRALADDMAGGADPALLGRALPAFYEAYADHVNARSRLYPGVRECLDALRAAGVPLGVVTNKPDRFVAPLLAAHGISAAFAVVLGAESVPRLKPDPQPFLLAAERLDAAPAQTAVVGDSETDVRAARAAGMAVVCVPYGYNQGRDVRELAPDAVVDTLADLPALLGLTRGPPSGDQERVAALPHGGYRPTGSRRADANRAGRGPRGHGAGATAASEEAPCGEGGRGLW